MKLAIGADHRGYEYKETIKHEISAHNKNRIEWIDVGTFSKERTDYPIFAKLVSEHIVNGKADAGILICGSGVGMAITANRYAHIYAALVWNKDVARISREQDNSNVLVLPSDFITQADALEMVQSWLAASFQGDRYQKRIEMIDAITR